MSYWLGGVDYFEEGTWQWANGDPFEYSNWHEGEPNNVDNEVRVSILSQQCSNSRYPNMERTTSSASQYRPG